jgi:hypothetical protein
MDNNEVIEAASEAFCEEFVVSALTVEERRAERVPKRDPNWPYPGVRLVFHHPPGFEVILGVDRTGRGAIIEILDPDGVQILREHEHEYASAPDPVEALRAQVSDAWSRAVAD